MVYRVEIQREMHQVYFFFLDGPFQDALKTTTLLAPEKFMEDYTADILQMNYKYGHTPFDRLQAMTTNGVLPNCLDNYHLTFLTAFLYDKAT